jgi:hypothetical protein
MLTIGTIEGNAGLAGAKSCARQIRLSRKQINTGSLWMMQTLETLFAKKPRRRPTPLISYAAVAVTLTSRTGIATIAKCVRALAAAGVRQMSVDERRSGTTRRSGGDRRSGADTRPEDERQVTGERRSAPDRRSGMDRRDRGAHAAVMPAHGRRD